MSKLLKWIVNIILLGAIIVAGALLIPPLAGITTVIVDDLELVTNLPKGSVTYAVDRSIQELGTGDNILIEETDGTYVYQVKSVDASTGKCELKDVKGADGKERSETFRNNVAKVVFTVPFIGYVVMAMKSTEGLIIIGLAVVFVIILFILAELWKTDDGDDEADDEENAELQAADEDSYRPAEDPSQIMEEVSNVIASEVSSVVAEESVQANESESELQIEEEEDLTQFDEAKIVAELTAALQSEQVEEDVQEDMQEEEPAEVVESEEKEEQEEMQEEEIELAMPIYSAEELIQKAKDEGDNPIISVDKEAGITVLDYSEII